MTIDEITHKLIKIGAEVNDKQAEQILDIVVALGDIEKSHKAAQCEDVAISKKAALDCLTASGLKRFDFILDARDKIENLPPVQPKAEWIPIKTRPLTEKEKVEMDTEAPYMYDCPLPDDGEEVEITTHLGDVTMDIFCRDPEGCYFEHYCDDGDVLAWRHKPEPYKVESEEV